MILRPRLHHVYFALAAFDLLTVSLGLYLINRLADIYEESVAVNQVWATRLNEYSELSRLAAAVNGPGNDVFQSGDIRGESARLAGALARFNERAAIVRRDLVRNVGASESPELLAAFDAIPPAMREMAVQAQSIFSYLQRREPEQAARRMARMDREFASVNAALARLSGRVRAIQTLHFQQQIAHAAGVRRFELVIASLVVLMVAGVTFYGSMLATRMRQNRAELARHRDHLEELVAERTAELRASHQQLRLAERLASVGTLAAGLGHDMNNLLFPVLCRLDALDAAGLDDQAAEEVAQVRQSIEYLQQLSDGLRLMVLDPDDPDASRHTTDLRSWADEVAPLLRAALPRESTLEYDIPDDVPPIAVAPHRLTQAVYNLVVNASEAISRGGTITVRAEVQGEGRLVRVSVTDNGKGMPAEVAGRALEPFFTTKKRHLSTGLGLALVHGVATSAGGSVEIESSPGAGTTVTLNLLTRRGACP